jgi:hypothetical protein
MRNIVRFGRLVLVSSGAGAPGCAPTVSQKKPRAMNARGLKQQQCMARAMDSAGIWCTARDVNNSLTIMPTAQEESARSA